MQHSPYISLDIRYQIPDITSSSTGMACQILEKKYLSKADLINQANFLFHYLSFCRDSRC